jgi:hypothetical protein
MMKVSGHIQSLSQRAPHGSCTVGMNVLGLGMAACENANDY